MAEHESKARVPEEISQLINSWSSIPAFVRDRHLNVLIANDIARSISIAFQPGVNLARSTFREVDVLQTQPDTHVIATHVAGTLRQSLNKHELDSDFESIIDDLNATSTDFADAWVEDGNMMRAADTFPFTAETVGNLRLSYLEFDVPGYFDLTLVIWRASDDASQTALDNIATGGSAARNS